MELRLKRTRKRRNGKGDMGKNKSAGIFSRFLHALYNAMCYILKWQPYDAVSAKKDYIRPNIKGKLMVNIGKKQLNPSKKGDVYVFDGDEEYETAYPLTAGYYRAVCLGVIELPDGESFILVFDPYDELGQWHTEICLTITRNVKSSQTLGELLFALGMHEGMHSDSSVVINSVGAFRSLFENAEVGIEVSENPETGLLYITDFFNLVDTEEFPTCPDEIVRNVF